MPSLDAASQDPSLSPFPPPALVRVAVGVAVDAQAACEEAWNTSTAPAVGLVPGAPRRASLPSAERATASPKSSAGSLSASERIAVGDVFDTQAFAAETW